MLNLTGDTVNLLNRDLLVRSLLHYDFSVQSYCIMSFSIRNFVFAPPKGDSKAKINN